MSIEHEPGSGGGSSEYRVMRFEKPPQNLHDEIEQLYPYAQTELVRQILEKILSMLDAKERAKRLAQYIATANPRDITTYFPDKYLGIILACDTTSPDTYYLNNTVIHRGDRLIQLHIPPRLTHSNHANPILADLPESIQLVSDYIRYHHLRPDYITGCTYEPLVTIAQRRYGFHTVRVGIPDEWADRISYIFHRFIDSDKDPKIGFIYQTGQEFKVKFPSRI